jgi:aldose 1-epimerase
MTDDTEIELRAGTWSATVSSLGAGLRGVMCAGQPVVTGYRGTAAKVGGQGDVLIPFPGRVANGSYLWDGVRYQLPITDKDGPNAIHGFVRTVPWAVSRRSRDAVTFVLDFAGAEGYPFPLRIAVTYALSMSGLTVTCRITNTGNRAAPVAMGFHPYFTVGSALVDSDTLTLPFSHVLEFQSLIPTGTVLAVQDTDLDFRLPRVIGSTQFNHCFLTPSRDADGLAWVTMSAGVRSVSVWMDRGVDFVVLYTGDQLAPASQRRSLAIEPMSCGSDAFNHADWGLRRLEAGAEQVATWGVTAAM